MPLLFSIAQEDPRNYRPISLTSVPVKVIEEIIMGAIERCLKNKAIIRHSQHVHDVNVLS